MHAFRTLFFAGALMLAAMAGQAQILVTFDQNPITTAPGTTVNFTGELTNTGATTLFINGDSVNLVGMGLTFDDSAFLLNAPVSLAPGVSTSSFTFFTVSSDVSTPPGTYIGAFSVLGGPDGSTTDELSGAVPPAFEVDLVLPNGGGGSDVPEPGSLSLCAGLAMIGTSLFLKHWGRKTTGQTHD